jgi:hypothetical protein
MTPSFIRRPIRVESSSHKTVLHVSQPTTEGVARAVLGLLPRQLAHGYRVFVGCPAGGELAEMAGRAGAEHVVWEAVRDPLRSVADVIELSRIVDQVRPDIVHLHSSKAGLAGRLALRGRLPTVFQPNAWSFLALTGAARSAAGRGCCTRIST